ncbi:MAG: hypothetical protein ACK4OM_05395 [Alphaproteobacteria bacterium]
MNETKDLEIWESIIEDIKEFLKDEQEKIRIKKNEYNATINEIREYSKKCPHLKEKIEKICKELDYGFSLSASIKLENIICNEELLNKLHKNLSNCIDKAKQAFYNVKYIAERLNDQELKKLYSFSDLRINYLTNSKETSESFIMLTVLKKTYYEILKATIPNFEKYDKGMGIVDKNGEIKEAYRIILPGYVFDKVFSDVIEGYILKEPLVSFIKKELDHVRNPIDGLQEHYLKVILAPVNKDLIIKDLNSNSSKLYIVILNDINRAESKQIKIRREIIDSLKSLIDEADKSYENNPLISTQEQIFLEKIAGTLNRLSSGYWESVSNPASWNDESKNIVQSTIKIQSWVRREQAENNALKMLENNPNSNLAAKIKERRKDRAALNR